MRSVVLLAMVLGFVPPALAQRPRASPHETHDFTIDGSTITIEYGRPYKRGRQIWGGLNPWGRWWMPGADEATIISTAHPLVIGGLMVPEGRHTLYMWVDPDAPKLIINNQVGQFHTVYNANRDLGRIDLTLRKLSEPVEQLTFAIDPRPEGGGTLKLIWDDREYSVPFTIKR
jgi:hypothetical protein